MASSEEMFLVDDFENQEFSLFRKNEKYQEMRD